MKSHRNVILRLKSENVFCYGSTNILVEDCCTFERTFAWAVRLVNMNWYQNCRYMFLNKFDNPDHERKSFYDEFFIQCCVRLTIIIISVRLQYLQFSLFRFQSPFKIKINSQFLGNSSNFLGSNNTQKKSIVLPLENV